MSVTLESASRLSALKSKIDTAVGSSSSTLSQAVDKALAKANVQTEEKTVTPTASAQTVTPTSGKYLSKVTVNAVPTETKSVTPTASAQTVSPTSGKFLSKVTVNAVPTQTKTVTPTESDQTVTPDSGKFLSSVLVKAAAASGKTVHTGTYEHGDYSTEAVIDTGVTLGADDIFIFLPALGDFFQVSDPAVFAMRLSEWDQSYHWSEISADGTGYYYYWGTDPCIAYSGTSATVTKTNIYRWGKYRWILIQ